MSWGPGGGSQAPGGLPLSEELGVSQVLECQSWRAHTGVGPGGAPGHRGGPALREGGLGVPAAMFPWRGGAVPCQAVPGAIPAPVPVPVRAGERRLRQGGHLGSEAGERLPGLQGSGASGV